MPLNWRKVVHHRHGPFAIAAAVAVLALPVFIAGFPDIAAGLTVVIFFLTYLVLMAFRIPAVDADRLRRTAQNEDEPAAVILAVTLAAAAAAIILLFEALNRKGGTAAAEVGLAFASVLFGWLTIHTMFAMHYAHLYWRPDEQNQKDEDKRGGLDFPQTDEPGAYDFLYFSFVIGMTAQTSDVAITSTAMRRVNLVHAIVSFFFNTVLVAASVNAAVGLGQ
ncbi:DUF1345 domain-containing protein [Neorhizobium alkalisoli]|uniref:Putative membrane protein n=1 Tax=Neorhizobium alkalisoli TaxID=528178 RepID=A0A561QUX8_9HYPH|nr:DUF1345 domain-containing protein [Neorhizobium alkalisoli]TWF54194.1 putative membrane protein [Neorhizobium alkalisoli]